MRAGLAALALAAVLSGCGGGGVSDACGDPGVPAQNLLTTLTDVPASPEDACGVAGRFSDVIVPQSLRPASVRLAETGSEVQVWQPRSLTEACTGCAAAGLNLAFVRERHPEWILHDRDGNEVTAGGDPDRVVMDFGNVDYQAAWAGAIADDLGRGGWTGVEVVDAGNDPEWSADPIDPRTGRPMAEDDRERYLAEALALSRGALKTDLFDLVAQNGPPARPVEAQIGSTDAVSAGEGFARLRGPAWDELHGYFEVAADREVGAWVEDIPPPDAADRLFAFASYLLVAGPGSAYAAPDPDASPLYRLATGSPTADAQAQAGAWVRTFEHATVAVNPGRRPVRVQVEGMDPFELPSGQAAIAVDGRLVTGG
jgi:hypothetical protein